MVLHIHNGLQHIWFGTTDLYTFYPFTSDYYHLKLTQIYIYFHNLLYVTSVVFMMFNFFLCRGIHSPSSQRQSDLFSWPDNELCYIFFTLVTFPLIFIRQHQLQKNQWLCLTSLSILWVNKPNLEFCIPTCLIILPFFNTVMDIKILLIHTKKMR